VVLEQRPLGDEGACGVEAGCPVRLIQGLQGMGQAGVASHRGTTHRGLRGVGQAWLLRGHTQRGCSSCRASAMEVYHKSMPPHGSQIVAQVGDHQCEGGLACTCA